jgi:predicted enzyme related to lactoylglutathione lyase
MLSIVYVVKIAVTLVFWSLPLILLSPACLECIGFPRQTSYMFVRLLGWAFLVLCIGYAFGLKASLRGERDLSSIYAGIVSNAGSSIWLAYFGASGAWATWSETARVSMWASAGVTAFIAAGLVIFGVLCWRPSISPLNHREMIAATAFRSSRDVIIRALALAEAAKFYGSVLGLPAMRHSEKLWGFETGAFCLYVEEGEMHGPVFEFLVADVEEAKQRLVAAGCVVVEENASIPRCYIRDPYGVVFNIGQARAEE